MSKEMRLVNVDALLEHLYNKQTEKVDIALEIAEFPTVDAVPIEEHRMLCHEFYLQGKWEGAFEATQDMDAASVVRGHWIDSSNGWMCSICERDNTYDKPECPNCGAKMDGTVTDDMLYCANGVRKEIEDGTID